MNMGATSNTALVDKKVDRLIGHIKGLQKGPTVVFFGGVHGNEMAGVHALEEVFLKLDSNSPDLKGSIFGIRGNLPAISKGARFLEKDLNRLWTEKNIKEIVARPKNQLCKEEAELLEINQLILKLLSTCEPPYYFIDLHTTSSKSLPFITMSDAMINRKFSRLFPVPIILGIEEFLEGPLLSHMNKKGYVSLGFESGQHFENSSVENSISFIWLALFFIGTLHEMDETLYRQHYNRLRMAAQGKDRFYEVKYRLGIDKHAQFEMRGGFESFQNIKKGTLLAKHEQEEIKTKSDSILFMPLYQNLGEDGFFLIRKIPFWALKFSSILRKMKMDSVLTLLPGVSWSNENKENLKVNLTIARFFTKSFFHLLGYRNRTLDENHVLMQNRERFAKTQLYENTSWYKGRFR